MILPSTCAFGDGNGMICLFSKYTQTQLLLSVLALSKFREYYKLKAGRDTAYVHRDEIVPYIPFHKALYATKTMKTKSVQIIDFGVEHDSTLLYSEPFYVDVKYDNKAIFFRVNLALKPYWEDILGVTLKLRDMADDGFPLGYDATVLALKKYKKSLTELPTNPF
ncbi:MAG: hypothetical protein MUF58_02520 [Arcicella sp.]|nr:hypothetical protein [Arcicella sp.]